MKRKALIIIGIVVTLFVAVFLIQHFLLRSAEEVKCQAILKYISKEYENEIKFKKIELSTETKDIEFHFIVERNGNEKYNAVNNVRHAFEKFLKDNPDYFINDSYRIRLAFYSDYGPLDMGFANFCLYGTHGEQYNNGYTNDLNFACFDQYCPSEQLKLFSDIIGITYLPIRENYDEFFSCLPNLKYYSSYGTITDEDKKNLLKYKPDLIIIK